MGRKLKLRLTFIVVVSIILFAALVIGIYVTNWWLVQDEYSQLAVNEAYNTMKEHYDKLGIVYTSDELTSISLYDCMTTYFPDMSQVATDLDMENASALRVQAVVVKEWFNATVKFGLIAAAVSACLIVILVIQIVIYRKERLKIKGEGEAAKWVV